MVCIAVSALVATGESDTRKARTPSEDQIELVPVFGPGVSPRDTMLKLGVKIGVCDAEIMVAAELKQALSVFIRASNTKVT